MITASVYEIFFLFPPFPHRPHTARVEYPKHHIHPKPIIMIPRGIVHGSVCFMRTLSSYFDSTVRWETRARYLNTGERGGYKLGDGVAHLLDHRHRTEPRVDVLSPTEEICLVASTKFMKSIRQTSSQLSHLLGNQRTDQGHQSSILSSQKQPSTESRTNLHFVSLRTTVGFSFDIVGMSPMLQPS